MRSAYVNVSYSPLASRLLPFYDLFCTSVTLCAEISSFEIFKRNLLICFSDKSTTYSLCVYCSGTKQDYTWDW